MSENLEDSTNNEWRMTPLPEGECKPKKRKIFKLIGGLLFSTLLGLGVYNFGEKYNERKRLDNSNQCNLELFYQDREGNGKKSIPLDTRIGIDLGFNKSNYQRFGEKSIQERHHFLSGYPKITIRYNVKDPEKDSYAVLILKQQGNEKEIFRQSVRDIKKKTATIEIDMPRYIDGGEWQLKGFIENGDGYKDTSNIIEAHTDSIDVP